MNAKSLVMAAYTSPKVHRAIPAAVIHQLVDQRVRRAWQRPEIREHARLRMEYLVGNSSRAGDLDELARSYVFERYKQNALRFRNWETLPSDVRGIEGLDTSRGVILNFMHHGFYQSIPAAMKRHGHPLVVPIHDDLATAELPPHQRQHLATVTEVAGEMFPARGNYDRMLAALKDGRVLMLASDVPGNSRTTFLGRPIQASSGAARLALDACAPIVLITAHPVGRWGQQVRLEEPIDPANFSTPQALLDEIFRRHEPAILAWPGAVEEPLWRWKPGDRADYPRFALTNDEIKALRL